MLRQSGLGLLAGLSFGLVISAAARAETVLNDSQASWLTGAQSDAANLNDPAEKAGVLTTIAYGWSSLGDPRAADQAADRAAEAATQIQDPQAKFEAYMGLAGVHDASVEPDAAQQALHQAEMAIQEMPPGPQRQDAQQRLSQFRSIVAGFAPTRKYIMAHKDPSQRAQDYAALADGFARAGGGHHEDFIDAATAAAEASEHVQDPVQRDSLRATIVQTEARGGDLQDAVSLSRRISDPAAQAMADAALADEYAKEGKMDLAHDAVSNMVVAAGNASDDRRPAIWLSIARVRLELGDKPGAMTALDSAASAASGLEPADRADLLTSAARMRSELGDTSRAAVLASDAAAAAQSVTDMQDATEVWMSVAAAQARCGLGSAALQSIAAARGAAAQLPADKRNPAGDPPPQAFLDVIQAAANANDFGTAQSIASSVDDPHLRHDAALAIATAEVNLGQYQAAEDMVAKEGSQDSEAAVCGIIAASLARTRDTSQAAQWISRLTNPSDKVAAKLAVAQVLQDKAPAAGAPPTP